MDFVSLLGTVFIVMILIWLLPYLLWFFVIMGIVIWISGFFIKRKIRKHQNEFFQQFQNGTSYQNNYTYTNEDDIDRGGTPDDIIDVEYTEKEE